MVYFLQRAALQKTLVRNKHELSRVTYQHDEVHHVVDHHRGEAQNEEKDCHDFHNRRSRVLGSRSLHVRIKDCDVQAWGNISASDPNERILHTEEGLH